MEIITIALPRKIAELIAEQEKIFENFKFYFDDDIHVISLISEDYDISYFKKVKLFSASEILNSDLTEIGPLASKIVKNIFNLDGVLKVGIAQHGLKITTEQSCFKKINL